VLYCSRPKPPRCSWQQARHVVNCISLHIGAPIPTPYRYTLLSKVCTVSAPNAVGTLSSQASSAPMRQDVMHDMAPSSHVDQGAWPERVKCP